MPALSQVHIDTALTNVSIMYANDEFHAEDVAPVLPTEKRSDKYFVYGLETALQGSGLDANGKPISLRRPGAEASETNYTLSTDNYYAEQYAKRQLVTDDERQYSDNPLSPDIDATVSVTEKLKIDNEMGTAFIACTSTNYGSANKVLLTTGGTGTSWAQYSSANSHPLSNIRDGKIAIRKAMLRDPNGAIYTIDAAQTLADHPDIKDLVKYTHVDALTSSGLPKVLRGLMTYEAATQRLTSAEGAVTKTTGNIWQDENATAICLIFYRSSDASPRSVHFMRTFEAPNPTTNVRGFSVRKYRDEPKAGEWVECAVTRDWKAVSKNGSGQPIGGYLISGCTA